MDSWAKHEKYLVSTSIKVINGGEQTLKKVVVGCEENSHGWIKHKDIQYPKSHRESARIVEGI